ncbi:MAG TPA: YibE/F family protein [Anaerolineales bacterium]|nr:YibE/F family protein [Anaerolineales bacterium]
MSRDTRLFIFFSILLIFTAGGAIFLLLPRLGGDETPRESTPIGYPSETAKARVVEVLETGGTEISGIPQNYKILRVEVVEGRWQAQEFEINYGLNQAVPSGFDIQPGDEILITVGQNPDRVLSAFFTDFVRIRPLLWLVATFVISIILISGWKGVRALLGMAFSLLVILTYIIPNILRGDDPVLVSITGAFVLLSVTLYLVYGWTLKTHAAVLATLIALVITGALSAFFVNLTRLTGFESEESLFLIQQASVQINLQGLLLGGMLIGALGVLDDLVITQSSVVFEILGADRTLTMRGLFWKGMRVGQDHVAATVNTLVLAYTGAALPMLLLFSLSGEAFGNLVNLEFIAVEIVRTLVGSLGLIAAVPITTGLASALALNRGRLGNLSAYLGPEGDGQDHSH